MSAHTPGAGPLAAPRILDRSNDVMLQLITPSDGSVGAIDVALAQSTQLQAELVAELAARKAQLAAIDGQGPADIEQRETLRKSIASAPAAIAKVVRHISALQKIRLQSAALRERRFGAAPSRKH